MLNRVLSLLFGFAFLGIISLAADEAKTPPKTDNKGLQTDVTGNQERLKQQFKDFTTDLLRLAQRLESSPKAEDREKAQALKNALKIASDQGIEVKFTTLILALKSSESFKNLDTLQSVLTQNQEIREDLRKLIDILLKDDRAAQLRKEREEVQKLLEKLKLIIEKQERVQANTELGRLDKNTIAKAQGNVTKETKGLIGAKEGKEGKDGKGKDGKDAKGGDGKGKDGKEGKDAKGGDGKDGKEGKDGKGGDGKGKDAKGGDGKGGDGKGGDGKGGEGSDSKPPPPSGPTNPEAQIAKKQIQEGIVEQENSEKKIAKDDRPGASDDQGKAIDKLKQAQKKLEELLKQLREEELEKILAQLQGRCEKLLAMQIAVRDATQALDKIILGNADKKPSRADDQKSLELSDREEDIIKEANRTLTVIEAEGSAVAFAEIFKQVLGDMHTVAGRLRRADTGSVTVTIENDIIDSLREMVEALKKARKDNQQPPMPPMPGSPGQPPDQRLIDMIAELKMIRSMQVRVNNRTTMYGKQFDGEQVPPLAIAKDDKDKEKVATARKEFKDLSERQQKLGKVTDDIAKGRNKGQ
ncbi:MAG: hypothetical protein EXR99_08740 [Gemmataceae bacterium]|nr:hypothetical protein [Gemmataceae bacterium]